MTLDQGWVDICWRQNIATADFVFAAGGRHRDYIFQGNQGRVGESETLESRGCAKPSLACAQHLADAGEACLTLNPKP